MNKRDRTAESVLADSAAVAVLQANFIFESESNAAPASFLSSEVQNFVHRLAVWRWIVESPEIEAAHDARAEDAGQLDTAFQDFTLLIEAVIRIELITLNAEPGRWCFGPIDF